MIDESGQVSGAKITCPNSLVGRLPKVSVIDGNAPDATRVPDDPVEFVVGVQVPDVFVLACCASDAETDKAKASRAETRSLIGGVCLRFGNGCVAAHLRVITCGHYEPRVFSTVPPLPKACIRLATDA